MNHGPGVIVAAAILGLWASPVMAQGSGHVDAPITYECAANAHCSIICTVDGEKVFQTGSPKTITVTPLSPSNYLVDFVEQSGHAQSVYLAGTKIVCNLDGLTKKAAP